MTHPREEVITLDLRGQQFDNLDQFWDAVAEPLQLPSWFGRNMDAWHDTLVAGGISPHLDAHTVVLMVT